MKKHRLILGSVRDVDAQCSCGRWFYSATTTLRDNARLLRLRAIQKFRAHLHQIGETAGLNDRFLP